MGAQLNHTIVWCADQAVSSRFLAEMLGRPARERKLDHWADPFMRRPGEINRSHGGE
jgi:hypothetical protein